MICYFLSMIIFVIVFIFVLKWTYDRQIQKLLNAHQKEWDEIKQKLKGNGATEIEIFDKYSEYIEHLRNKRDSIYAACFPRE